VGLLSLAKDTDSIIGLASSAWVTAITLWFLQAASVTGLADTLSYAVCWIRRGCPADSWWWHGVYENSLLWL